VQAQLPLVSTYVGHADPRHTYWYLSGAPELLALAAERLEAATPSSRATCAIGLPSPARCARRRS
jgi:integrase/recombinase XerD